MGIKKGSTAAAPATTPPVDPYSPDNLIRYHISLGLVEKLVTRGELSRADYRKACQTLTLKYGLPADSIFAEIA
ncbi:MAG: hypothetical protein IIY28_09275 [Lachnospiraceae bacterium]|nr:hypothetical protein [Lachnospiraceae bacterium]